MPASVTEEILWWTIKTVTIVCFCLGTTGVIVDIWEFDKAWVTTCWPSPSPSIPFSSLNNDSFWFSILQCWYRKNWCLYCNWCYDGECAEQTSRGCVQLYSTIAHQPNVHGANRCKGPSMINITTPFNDTRSLKFNTQPTSAYFCYCENVLRISRYSGFLWAVPTNTGIFLRGLKLCGERRT